MKCSSRISRIIPESLPLTWDGTHGDFESTLTPRIPSSTSTLPDNGVPQQGPPSPVKVAGSQTASPRMCKELSGFGPIPPQPVSSGHCRQAYAGSSGARYRYCPADHAHCRSSESRGSVREHPMEKRSISFRHPSPTSPQAHSGQESLVHSRSPAGLPTSQKRMSWMTVATRVHRRYTQQNEQALANSSAMRHRRKFSHIVRTDALAPGSTQRSSIDAGNQTPYQPPPWITEKNEIDWATYFQSQPLPTSATWSRLQSTVDNVDGM